MGVLHVFKIVQMVPNCAKDHILTMMMIILMTMILELLFMLDLWLGVINVKDVHVKKNRWEINAYSMEGRNGV